jgi:tyrosyl-tRNA synthetase
LLPASALKTGKKEFKVGRERDGLEPLIYTEISKMHEDYKNDVLTPQLLKAAVAKALIELMAPIRKAFEVSAEWQKISADAYPEETEKEGPKKKEKKAKDKGSRYPGKPKEPKEPKDGEHVPVRPKE